MRAHRLASRSAKLAVVPLVLAGAAGVAPTAAIARADGHRQALAARITGQLNGVATISARNAWAVGSTTGPSLIEHWNGTRWKKVATGLKVNEDSALESVTALSASNAWAVGWSGQYASEIVHWNGKRWKKVHSPNPGLGGTALFGVAATSSTNAWAVGYTGAEHSVILHWNGRSWKRVPSPSPAYYSLLYGVTAISARNAWAVGFNKNTAGVEVTLIEHWNGKVWRRVPSPNPAGLDNDLFGVTATSSRNAWAVGDTPTAAGTSKSLTLHWNGSVWTHVPSPNPAGTGTSGQHGNNLLAVSATSARNAWAVGLTNHLGAFRTLILHWNGAAWAKVHSPNPGPCSSCNQLQAVAASSGRHAWAVGTNDSGFSVLIERWNGHVWK